MILLLRADASDEQVADLRARLDEFGFESSRLDDIRGRALEAHGEHGDELLALRDHPAVESLLANEAAPAAEERLWPHGALQISILLVLLLALLLALTAVAPAGLSDRAELDSQPPDGAVEWYLRPLAAFLHAVPAPIGGIAVLLFWAGLLLWPFIDRGGVQGSRRTQLLVRFLGALILAAMIGLALFPLP